MNSDSLQTTLNNLLQSGTQSNPASIFVCIDDDSLLRNSDRRASGCPLGRLVRRLEHNTGRGWHHASFWTCA